MKRCSTCNRTYTDPNLSFCIDDGTPLTTVPAEDESTVVSSSARDTSERNPAPYQPPGPYVPPATPAKGRRVWPWVVGIGGAFILGVVAISITAVFLAPRLLRTAQPRFESRERNNNQVEDRNSNQVSTTNGDAEVDRNAPAPTDHNQVLAQLTEIENEWTIANATADKRKLSRILADDYVGPNETGYPQTKAEYLRTIRPTPIESHKFYDLSLELTGDRAKLTGRATFVTAGEESELLFTDKFVWREGRWQATASEVGPVQ